jgi:hypothetical protein
MPHVHDCSQRILHSMTHRNVIDQVEQAYYRLLNSSGQEDSAQASLANAKAVEQQREFDDRLAESLDAIADQVEGRILGIHLTLEDAVARLENAIKIYHSRGPLASRFQALIVLGRRIEVAMVSVTNEILSNGWQSNH